MFPNSKDFVVNNEFIKKKKKKKKKVNEYDGIFIQCVSLRF